MQFITEHIYLLDFLLLYLIFIVALPTNFLFFTFGFEEYFFFFLRIVIFSPDCDFRLYRRSIFGAADEVELKFMNRCFLAYWTISYSIMKKV